MCGSGGCRSSGRASRNGAFWGCRLMLIFRYVFVMCADRDYRVMSLCAAAQASKDRPKQVPVPSSLLTSRCQPYRRQMRFTSEQGGEGIGLSLVKRICLRYGWCLEGNSELGAGTWFSLSFDA